MESQTGKLGILVGGGPAPGINSVISAATIRARLANVEVLGIRDGFENLINGNLAAIRPLNIEDVSRVHFRGGSFIGISRANPTKRKEDMAKVAASLRDLGISMLVTIGGDDTAFSAMSLKKHAGDALRVVHVPKTIDNDLNLPAAIDTFGYQTAREVGTQIVRDIMTDAKTTTRWYFIVAMGRHAGHLALGIGKAAGATLTLIPEEFGEGKIQFDDVVDTLVGAIIKRSSEGRRHGVAVIAEGLMSKIDRDNLPDWVKAEVAQAKVDDHDNLRLDEISTGDILKKAVQARLREFERFNAPTVVAKNVGYELRCAAPVPADLEYCRDLGYAAAKYITEGGDGAMVSIQGGRFVPVPFGEMIDPQTGKTQVRWVDILSTRYAIARRYMIRLRRDDFDNSDKLAQLASTTGISVEDFRREFEHTVRYEPPKLDLNDPRR